MTTFWIILTLIAFVSAAIPAFFLMRHRQILAAISTFIVIPLLAFPLYFYWGAPHALDDYYQLKTQAAKKEKHLAKREARIQRLMTNLENHLQNRPQDAKGWYWLGRLYLSHGKKKKGLDALKRATTLAPHNLQYKSRYAAGRYFQKGSLDLQAKFLLMEVLKENPRQPMALSLLATNAFLHQRYKKAIQFWKKLLPLYPKESHEKMALIKAIQVAKAKMAAAAR